MDLVTQETLIISCQWTFTHCMLNKVLLRCSLTYNLQKVFQLVESKTWQSMKFGDCILNILKSSLECFRNRKYALLLNADHLMQVMHSKNDTSSDVNLQWRKKQPLRKGVIQSCCEMFQEGRSPFPTTFLFSLSFPASVAGSFVVSWSGLSLSSPCP